MRPAAVPDDTGRGAGGLGSSPSAHAGGGLRMTVLGCSGSYGAPSGGACSGYLVRAGDANLWVDCGNGSFAQSPAARPPGGSDGGGDHSRAPRPLRRPLRPARPLPLRAGALGPPGLRPRRRREAPGEPRRRLGATPSTGTASATAMQLGWATSGCGSRRRTTRPRPSPWRSATAASASCTPRTRVRAGRPRRSARGADLLLCEATYQHDDIRSPMHLSARQAGEMARAAGARHLMLTHLWPGLDPVASVEEGSDAFGHAVVLAAPHVTTHI